MSCYVYMRHNRWIRLNQTKTKQKMETKYEMWQLKKSSSNERIGRNSLKITSITRSSHTRETTRCAFHHRRNQTNGSKWNFDNGNHWRVAANHKQKHSHPSAYWFSKQNKTHFFRFDRHFFFCLFLGQVILPIIYWTVEFVLLLSLAQSLGRSVALSLSLVFSLLSFLSKFTEQAKRLRKIDKYINWERDRQEFMG